MSLQYGYYLPLGGVYDSVRFLSIAPRMNGFGSNSEQKHDRNEVPMWSVSALVKRGDEPAATEVFSLTAPAKIADAIGKIPELSPIRLVGLAGGKWAKEGSDKTNWSFSINGVDVVSA